MYRRGDQHRGLKGRNSSMTTRLLLGAFKEWLKELYRRTNEILGPWLSPRRY